MSQFIQPLVSSLQWCMQVCNLSHMSRFVYVSIGIEDRQEIPNNRENTEPGKCSKKEHQNHTPERGHLIKMEHTLPLFYTGHMVHHVEPNHTSSVVLDPRIFADFFFDGMEHELFFGDSTEMICTIGRRMEQYKVEAWRAFT